MGNYNLEKEIGGALSRAEYGSRIIKLKKARGKLEEMKRLSIQITDFDNNKIDTRLRITNGKPALMQKVGDWNAESRLEIEVPVAGKSNDIYGLYQIITNLLTGHNLKKNIIQLHNTVLTTEHYEVKLTMQKGNEEVYGFEVEVFDHSIDPVEICKQYELVPDLATKDSTYWDEFNKKVNIDIESLSEKSIIEIIESYM